MTFVNSKLGNGFLIHPADSTKDQEHHFYSAKKTIGMSVVGLSSETDLINSSVFLTGYAYPTTAATHSIGFFAIAISGTLSLFGGALANVENSLVSNAVIFTSSDYGATIGKISEFNGGGIHNRVRKFGISPSGTLLAVGFQSGSSGGRGFVRRSTDAGKTWTQTLDFFTSSVSELFDVTFHPGDGNKAYACGYTTTGSLPSSTYTFWEVLSSSDAGANWHLINRFSGTFDSLPNAMAHSVVVNSSGTIFVGGFSEETNANGNWKLQSSSDGVSWGSIPAPSGTDFTRIQSLMVDKFDHIWAFCIEGFSMSGSGTRLMIASSSQGGASGTWGVVHRGDSTHAGTIAHQIIEDTNGNIIATARSGSGNGAWVIIQSKRRGVSGSWAELERPPETSGAFVYSTAIAKTTGSDVWLTAFSGTNDRGGWKSTSVTRRVRSIYDQPNQSSFTVTGSEQIFLIQSLRDTSNNARMSASFIQEVFGYSETTPKSRRNARLTFRVSSSNKPLDLNDFAVFFRDNNSTTWASDRDVESFGIFSQDSESGFYEFFSNFYFSGNIEPPVFSFNTSSILFTVETYNTGTIFTFEDFRISFDEPLTDHGVKRFREIDNQNMEFLYYNFNVMKKVDE